MAPNGSYSTHYLPSTLYILKGEMDKKEGYGLHYVKYFGRLDGGYAANIKFKYKGAKTMGLDVYVRWEGMTKEDRDAQITGYKNAGDKGYLRQSWDTLTAWNNILESVLGRPWDDLLNPQWEGYNDEEMIVTEDSRKLLEESKRILQEYVDSPKPLDESLKKYFGKEDQIGTVVSECQDMIDFISLALSKENSKITFS